MKNEEISLSKFLSRTLGLGGEKLSEITHDDVKVLFPQIKRSSFSFIEKNPQSLRMGLVQLVNDGRKTIPYYVPIVENNFEIQQVDFESIPKYQIEDKTYDYTKMSIYELKQLLNTKFNTYRNSREARRELERRGVVLTKKYKRCEIKRMKEDEI